MRLANLEGYLKFPGPFPVASIRLKYVARPAATERFVPREENAAAPDICRADTADAGNAGGDAFADREEIGIPEPGDRDAAGPADVPDPPDMPPEPASWQGELALIPLPGEDGSEAGGDDRPEAASAAEGARSRARRRKLVLTMLSIGALSSAAQGASYYERDGYYAKDDPEHRAASAWAGKGADELGLKGPVDPATFRAVLEGKVPDGSDTRLGRRGKDGAIEHRPGRDLTFSAPKSVSLAALVGGDERIVEAHDRAVAATLAWVEKNAAETRMKDPETGRMGRVGGQKIVAATFRHDTSRNLDPQLHTHAVLANMVRGEDGKWRSMANEGLYARQKLIGMLYRNELAAGLARLGYGIEKTHADGRFEIAGVSREAVEAFSTRRAEIEAAMAARDLGESAGNPRLAERAALMTRAAKRDIDRDELRAAWRKQAADLGLDARALVAGAMERSALPGLASGGRTGIGLR